jgi:hypothetical protein
VLGDLDPDTTPPREVGAMLLVTDMEHLPSFAFMASPAEIERGPLYEFFLNHVVRVSSPGELSRTVLTDIGVS